MTLTIADLRARLHQRATPDQKPYVDYDHEGWYRYADMIPMFYYKDALKPDWDQSVTYGCLSEDEDRDVIINRKTRGDEWGYPMGKYPWDDPILLSILSWCSTRRSFPKSYAMLNDEDASDVLLRFTYPKQKRDFVQEHTNIDAIYQLGVDPYLWLEDNVSQKWRWQDNRVLFADETDRTLFQVVFPEFRSLSTPAK